MLKERVIKALDGSREQDTRRIERMEGSGAGAWNSNYLGLTSSRPHAIPRITYECQ